MLPAMADGGPTGGIPLDVHRTTWTTHNIPYSHSMPHVIIYHWFSLIIKSPHSWNNAAWLSLSLNSLSNDTWRCQLTPVPVIQSPPWFLLCLRATTHPFCFCACRCQRLRVARNFRFTRSASFSPSTLVKHRDWGNKQLIMGPKLTAAGGPDQGWHVYCKKTCLRGKHQYTTPGQYSFWWRTWKISTFTDVNHVSEIKAMPRWWNRKRAPRKIDK